MWQAVDRFTYITVCEDSDIFLMQDKQRRKYINA